MLIALMFMYACEPEPEGKKTEYVTVTFNANGGAPEPAAIKLEKGTAMDTQYPTSLTKAGYAFGGWFNEATLYTSSTIINHDITLTAKWNKNITITFDADGGEPTPPVRIRAQGSQLGNVTNPTKLGLTFNGWWNSGKRYYNTTIIDADEDFTLTAMWIEVGVQVTNWEGFTIPGGTTAYKYNNLYERENVLLVRPSNATDYSWAVILYSLSDLIGKELTVTLSVDVWVDISVPIQWQANLRYSPAQYPMIAADTQIETGKWVTVYGTNTSITVPPNGGDLYLSGGGNGGQLQNKPVDIYLSNFSFTVLDNNLPAGSIFITVGDKKDLNQELPGNFTGPVTSWTSSDTSLVEVNSSGIAFAKQVKDGQTRYNTGSGQSDSPASTPARGQVKITATSASGSHEFNVYATTQGLTNIMYLPSLKDQFASYFKIGNIYRGTVNELSGTGVNAQISDDRLTRHFNAITAENLMKPSYLIEGRNASTGEFTWNESNRMQANNFVNAANNAEMDVIGHTLLWHNQNPDWVWNQIAKKNGDYYVSGQTAIDIMKTYITTVVTEFKGKVHTWDVLNEVFPDGSSGTDWKNSMRRTGNNDTPANPWLAAIGPDFVYEGFLAARIADPDAKLYYNDYNTETAGRRSLIQAMVSEVNQKYKTEHAASAHSNGGTRLLIEGIGMQEHHNLGVSASSIEATIQKFSELEGIELAVSELDIIAVPSYSSAVNGSGKNQSSTVTNDQLLIQADRYKEYMKMYMKYASVIRRVSLWGITDNTSWRSGGLPLLFDHAGRAKPAYYSFVGALE